MISEKKISPFTSLITTEVNLICSKDMAADIQRRLNVLFIFNGATKEKSLSFGQVRGFVGKDKLDEALSGMDLVIIPAGVPRKPGMTLCEGIGRSCPRAIVNLISNPVNSIVPIAAEVFKKAGTYDPKRFVGVAMLDVVRANTFVCFPVAPSTYSQENVDQRHFLLRLIKDNKVWKKMQRLLMICDLLLYIH